MNAIINRIKTFFNSKNTVQASVECNYANNYYGDQQCQSKQK